MLARGVLCEQHKMPKHFRTVPPGEFALPFNPFHQREHQSLTTCFGSVVAKDMCVISRFGGNLPGYYLDLGANHPLNTATRTFWIDTIIGLDCALRRRRTSASCSSVTARAPWLRR